MIDNLDRICRNLEILRVGDYHEIMSFILDNKINITRQKGKTIFVEVPSNASLKSLYDEVIKNGGDPEDTNFHIHGDDYLELSYTQYEPVPDWTRRILDIMENQGYKY